MSGTETDAWRDYAMHLCHCRPCGENSVHCETGQELRDHCFEGEFSQPPRDPELRRAALEALLAWRAMATDLTAALGAAIRGDVAAVGAFTSGNAVDNAKAAMDALKEALAK